MTKPALSDEEEWQRIFSSWSITRQVADMRKLAELTKDLHLRCNTALEQARIKLNQRPATARYDYVMPVEAWRALVGYAWFAFNEEYKDVQQTLSAVTITRTAIGEPFRRQLPRLGEWTDESWLNEACTREEQLQPEVVRLSRAMAKLRPISIAAKRILDIAQEKLEKLGSSAGEIAGVEAVERRDSDGKRKRHATETSSEDDIVQVGQRPVDIMEPDPYDDHNCKLATAEEDARYQLGFGELDAHKLSPIKNTDASRANSPWQGSKKRRLS